MSDDLIKRAREAAEPWDYGEPDTLITELVDRIEAQAAEIERLRGALNDAAEVIESCSAVFLRKWGTTNKWRNAVLAKARAALAGKAEQ